MIQAPDLPLWAAIAVGFFVLLGASITLVGALGLLRMGNFYERIHPPTLGTTWGTMCILIASMISFSTLHTRPMIHEILIAIRSEEHTSELQSLMRISYAVFCLKKKKKTTINQHTINKQNRQI